MNRRDIIAPSILRTGRGREGAGYSREGLTQNPQPPIFARRSSTGLDPYAGAWTYTEAAHLLRRCMVGPTDAEIRQAVADGLSATLVKLLSPVNVPLTLIDDWAGNDPQVRVTDQTMYQAFQDELQRKKGMFPRWWYNVIAVSPVSIQERLTIFWHNHFVSDLQTVNFAEFMYGQNQLLRSHILGNFKQFVKDITKDMAMLIYLDGIKNSKTGNRNNINENYGRELMELFTCGVVDWDSNPNYTQNDVSEAARALSGWTFTQSSKGASYLGLVSQFVQNNWDNGSKTLMGQTGNWKADDVVDIIFAQRGDQVAKFICGKIYRAFIYDVIDPVVVTGMAETLRTNNWELKPVIEQMLKSEHFFDMTNIGALEKSPVDYLVGMVRALNLGGVPDFNPAVVGRQGNELSGRCSTIGMALGDPPNVKGWPGGRTWVSTSTLPTRQKFGIDVSKSAIKVRGVAIYSFDAVAFAKTFPDYNDLRKLNTNMAQFLLNTQPSDLEKQKLLDTLLAGGVNYEWDIDSPDQKADARLRKFLEAVVQLAKYQLY